jgi:hypothetical protein
MRAIKIYHPPGRDAPFEAFLASLDHKLRLKLRRQLFLLAYSPQIELKEPHYKRFALERYSGFCELREKHQVHVRIIFTMYDGDILLLAPFVKKETRDTMRALERSIRILADVRENPDYAVNYNFWEDKKKP